MSDIIIEETIENLIIQDSENTDNSINIFETTENLIIEDNEDSTNNIIIEELTEEIIIQDSEDSDEIVILESVTEDLVIEELSTGVGEAPVDGKVYGRKDAAWEEVYDIVTPSSVGDNSIVRWDGTDGLKLQDSDIMISDSDQLYWQDGKIKIGTSSVNYFNNAIAIGIYSQIDSNYSIAIGRDSVAGGKDNRFPPTYYESAIAIGRGAEATHRSSVAIGANTISDEHYMFKVGGDLTSALFDVDYLTATNYFVVGDLSSDYVWTEAGYTEMYSESGNVVTDYWNDGNGDVAFGLRYSDDMFCIGENYILSKGNAMYMNMSEEFGIGANPISGYKLAITGDTNFNGSLNSSVAGNMIFNNNYFDSGFNAGFRFTYDNGLGQSLLLDLDHSHGADFQNHNIITDAAIYLGTSLNNQSGDGNIVYNQNSIAALGLGHVFTYNNGSSQETLLDLDYEGADFQALDILTTGDIKNFGSLYFDTEEAITSFSEGQMGYDDSQDLSLGMAGGNVTQQIGYELYIPRSKATEAILNGQVVQITGASGSKPEISLAKADTSANSKGTIAVAAEDITYNTNGICTSNGLVHDLDTSAFSDGDELFLSSTVAGAIVNVAPSAPYLKVKIGHCVLSHATEGIIHINIQQRTNNIINLRGTEDTAIYYGNSTDNLSGDVSNLYYDYTNTTLHSPNIITEDIYEDRLNLTGSPSSTSGYYTFAETAIDTDDNCEAEFQINWTCLAGGAGSMRILVNASGIAKGQITILDCANYNIL